MSKKILTTPFDSEDYAELSAAVEILGHRSLNAFVHQLVMLKIREAKSLVSPEEFAEIVQANKKAIGKRSKIKTKERLEMLGELNKDSVEILGRAANFTKTVERPLIEVGELAVEQKPKKKKAA